MTQFQFPLMPERKVWSVSDLTMRIRDLLAGEFTDVFVQGEVSNAHSAQSGHLYFTLKDTRAQIRCVTDNPRFHRIHYCVGLVARSRPERSANRPPVRPM